MYNTLQNFFLLIKYFLRIILEWIYRFQYSFLQCTENNVLLNLVKTVHKSVNPFRNNLTKMGENFLRQLYKFSIKNVLNSLILANFLSSVFLYSLFIQLLFSVVCSRSIFQNLPVLFHYSLEEAMFSLHTTYHFSSILCSIVVLQFFVLLI